MTWWLWTIICVVGWCSGIWLSVFCTYRFTRANEEDIDNLNFVHWTAWPFVLVWVIFSYLSSTGKPSLFSSAIKASEAIDRKAELRRLREMHEAKEEETYPIPHQTVPILTEAQRREVEGMRNTYNIAYGSRLGGNALAADTRSLPGETHQKWVQRVHGGKE